eukprot:jgi/Chlat1/3885/Chrsp26S00304
MTLLQFTSIRKLKEVVVSTTLQDTMPPTDKVTTTSGLVPLTSAVVGRRFASTAAVSVGQVVYAKREPDNPQDCNAILVVNEDQEHLGHLPARIAQILAPLLDEKLFVLKGAVMSSKAAALQVRFTPELTHTAAKSLAPVEESWREVVNNVSEDLLIARAAANFQTLLKSVMSNDGHLLIEAEHRLLGKYFELSANAQRLFVRVFQRKGPWFRVINLMDSYCDIDVRAALQELTEQHFFRSSTTADVESVKDRLAVLSVAELRDIATATNSLKRGDISKALKEQLQTAIAQTGRQQGPDAYAQKGVETLLQQTAGCCTAIDAGVSVLMQRMQRLFFCNEHHDLSTFLLVDIRKRKYPAYKCNRTRSSFPDREILLRYEQALERGCHVSSLLESMALTDVLPHTENFLDEALHSLICAPSKSAYNDYPFLARFTAAWVDALVLTCGVSLLERHKQFDRAIELLQALLREQWCPSKRGHWWERLCIDLQHAKGPKASLEVAKTALQDSWVRGGSRVALERKVARLTKRFSPYSTNLYPAALQPPCTEVVLEGRPLNCVVGMKSLFFGFDDSMCSVEQLALQHYASSEAGDWQGCHSESGIFLTLFGLLMWEVLFTDVPDVFRTEFQTAPLDLHTDAFYVARTDLIAAQVERIREGGQVEMLTKVWEAQQGTWCCGVSWERYTLAQLQEIAACIGGPGLAAICSLLAEDYALWVGGMPDLLLWKPEQLKAKLVEVKGPNDHLSDDQRAWIMQLQAAGVDVEVCKVLPPQEAAARENKKRGARR